LLTLIASQPAAANMCFVEIYAAGPEGVAVVDRTLDRFEKFANDLFLEIPGRENTPAWMLRAMIGGLQKVIHKRLYRDEEQELVELAPQIWSWWLSYPPPPGPLRAARRRSRKGHSFEERQAASNPPERVLRALAAEVAEKGYPEITVAEIVERAATSQRTFYEHFANREDALIAALDSGSALMLGKTLPAFRRAQDWQHAVRRAYDAMFEFGIEEPEYSRLGAVEMYAAGKRALQTRDTIMEGLEALLAPGYEIAPETPPIAAEAIGGAIYALVYDQVKAKGPESLPELAPMATYMTLAPFIGAEDAYALATLGPGNSLKR
jgi:AcrR family transcriptional regulator